MIDPPEDVPMMLPMPVTKRELQELHWGMERLKYFVHMNYFPADKPPHEDDIVALQEYIERACKRAL